MKLLLFISGFFATIHLLAQEESFPCKEPNQKLKELVSNGVLDNLYVHDCSGVGLHELASSFLTPNGIPPEIIEDPEGQEPPDDTEYVNWTCKYAPGNLQDNDPSTAWVEGSAGNGVGEVILVPCLDLKTPVEIWAGYGKSENLFKNNSRPRKLNLMIIKAKQGSASQYGIWYRDLTVVGQTEFILLDRNDFQSLSIPDYKIESYFNESYESEVDYKYFLGIEIIDVYKGLQWEDTCISEIRNKI